MCLRQHGRQWRRESWESAVAEKAWWRQLCHHLPTRRHEASSLWFSGRYLVLLLLCHTGLVPAGAVQETHWRMAVPLLWKRGHFDCVGRKRNPMEHRSWWCHALSFPKALLHLQGTTRDILMLLANRKRICLSGMKQSTLKILFASAQFSLPSHVNAM